ncbi:hypothetical protein LZG00_13980 [Rhodobacteraceae bacterium LMO-12]|nr:hypothetical protein [Rhodobacteraceae bacterium LMO-JJ12]
MGIVGFGLAAARLSDHPSPL